MAAGNRLSRTSKRSWQQDDWKMKKTAAEEEEEEEGMSMAILSSRHGEGVTCFYLGKLVCLGRSASDTGD